MTKSKSNDSYEELKAELDAIMVELQRDDVDVDEALKQYERGLELVKQLEAKLKLAENTVRELKAKFDTAS
jgi:exodeoxyribonuclease VII small subunit